MTSDDDDVGCGPTWCLLFLMFFMTCANCATLDNIERKIDTMVGAPSPPQEKK